MKLRSTDKHAKPDYPPYEGGRNLWLKTLVVGASITVAGAFVSCARKDAESTDNKDKAAPGTPMLPDKPATPPMDPPKEALDTDNDGIPDAQDLCKTVPGYKKWHGCPHSPTRTAGVPRRITPPNQIQLPQLKGPATKTAPGATKDSDGDGVPDAKDKCPTVRGDDGNGCPIRKKGLIASPRPMK
ncbi:thrombospondin type 3 repeat-containing protein [Myxococcota bacterium]|nr:thrombospondin type 3 repeat-containing protein [Myxococcota bacterium]